MKEVNCLEDHELWGLLSAESPVKHEHLKNCPSCQNRFEQLKRSLLEIQDVIDDKSFLNFSQFEIDSCTHFSMLELDDDFNGISISRYRILRSLSYGGQGQVYLAEDVQLNRNVAVKISHYSISEDLVSSELIRSEGELLAKINHPQLAHVYDAGVEDGRPFLVMEYIAGQTMQDYLGENRLSTKQVQRIIREIAKAVQAIHDCGILHLDLKPENVIITPNGQCKVVDLGTSWLMSQSAIDGGRVIGGTRAFMSPEQARGDYENVGPWTDVFGLGALLYSLLVNCEDSALQSHNDLRDGLWRRGPQELAQVENRKFLKKICLKAISYDPGDRYQSVSDFMQTFEIAERRRQGYLLAASGLISCCLGGLQLVQYMPASPSVQWNNFVEVDTNSKILPNDETSEVRYLQIRAVNLPAGPLHFCVWSKRDGLHFLPAVRDADSQGRETLRMLAQRQGLKLLDPNSPYWIMIIAEEFQGITGRPEVKQQLATQLEQQFQGLERVDHHIRFLNSDLRKLALEHPLFPEIRRIRQQKVQNIYLYELDLGA